MTRRCDPPSSAQRCLAGILVGAVNQLLAQAVVGVRLRALATGMQRVEHTLVDATYSGDWESCDPTSCMVPVDSTDDLGEVAVSFNRLVAGLAASHRVNDGVTAMGEALASHLELEALAESTLQELTTRTGGSAAALMVVSNGRIELAGALGIRDSDRLLSAEVVQSTVRTRQPTVLQLPPDLVVSGAVVDFVPQEVRVLPVLYGVADSRCARGRLCTTEWSGGQRGSGLNDARAGGGSEQRDEPSGPAEGRSSGSADGGAQ